MTKLQGLSTTHPSSRQSSQTSASLEGRRFLKVAEAALYLSVNLFTIYAWVNEGRLPASRIGRAIRIDKRRLDEMLEGDLRAAPAVDRGRGWRS